MQRPPKHKAQPVPLPGQTDAAGAPAPLPPPRAQELVNILLDGPGTPLANSALSSLMLLSLLPEGRKLIMLKGGATPIIRCGGRLLQPVSGV